MKAKLSILVILMQFLSFAGTSGNVLSENAAAEEIIAAARSMLPRDIELKGRIILRNRKGIPQLERAYTLKRVGGATEIDVDDETLSRTDVTRDDLALAYLEWKDVAFDKEREGESVNGQTCAVLLLKNGERSVRVWVDRKTGALMQAEELEKGEPRRRLWGTRIKKFGERWMANVMEVETLGSGHRTKITVEEVK